MNQTAKHTAPPPSNQAAAYGYEPYSSSAGKAWYARSSKTDYTYFGARYYDSDLSLWLSVDPLAKKYPSLSPYVYVANNPVILVDPDGNKIVVTRTVNDNGKDVVNITVTAKLYNGSKSNYSKNEMNNMANSISNQIKDSFGGEYENCKVQVSVNIETISELSETKGDDHLFIIVDNSDLKNSDGTSDAGSSNVGGQVAKINADITNDDKQLKRTAAHEFGHMAGLEHPENESDASVREAASNDKTNLMHQSKVTSGTTIVEQQIIKIENENKE